MQIQESNDAELRQLIYKHDRVLVKFIDNECNVCKELAPAFEKLSKNPKYKDVLFVRMNASENPVSSKEVKLTGTPFFAAYNKGLIIDCGLVNKEEDIFKIMEKLIKS